MALILNPQSFLPTEGFNWIVRITTERAYIRYSDLLDSQDGRHGTSVALPVAVAIGVQGVIFFLYERQRPMKH